MVEERRNIKKEEEKNTNALNNRSSFIFLQNTKYALIKSYHLWERQQYECLHLHSFLLYLYGLINIHHLNKNKKLLFYHINCKWIQKFFFSIAKFPSLYMLLQPFSTTLYSSTYQCADKMCRNIQKNHLEIERFIRKNNSFYICFWYCCSALFKLCHELFKLIMYLRSK